MNHFRTELQQERYFEFGLRDGKKLKFNPPKPPVERRNHITDLNFFAYIRGYTAGEIAATTQN